MLPGMMGLRLPPPPASASSLIVAVGATNTSTAYIATSPDGITWTSQSVTGSLLYGVAFSSSLGLYCAVGNSGLIVTSPDGITWTSRTSGTSNAIRAVTWVNGLFVATGNQPLILTSPDGITWTSRTSPLGTGTYNAAVSIGSRAVLLGSDGGGLGRAAYSDNGTSWTGVNLPGVGFSYSGLGSRSGQIVGVGSGGRIVTSTDATSWTAQTSGTSFGLADAEWNGSLFVAIGPAQICTSPDGVTWTDRTGGAARNWNGVTWTGTQFVAAGSSSSPLTPRILTSPDGLTWTEQSIGLSSAGFNAVCS